jgi:hypothetical protein
MSYRTKRRPTRSLLAFGVGATLAIMQLGAGCVPASTSNACGADATGDETGRCVSPNDAAKGGDEK